MTDKNKKIYDKLNITKWHKSGITGKGVHVAILGYETKAWHNGASIIKEVAPDCKVTELNVMKGEGKMGFDDAIKWCVDNDVDVVCCSLQKMGWNSKQRELSKTLYDNGCIMIDSADNDSREIDRYPALDPSWFVVGAYDANENGLAGYSNYGDKMLCLSYTNIDALTAKGNYTSLPHTSGATQIPCGIAALLKQHCNITPKEFEKFVDRNAIKLGNTKKDKRTGYGLICMPEKVIGEYDMEIKLTIGSNVAKVNGKDVQLDTSAFIKDNRTFVPVRFIAEALGCEIKWDAEKQEVIILK